ncbi:CIC11C00000001827 [Sungouiella intermedia]|uniref:nicotinamidase n=1 Tax=Sungouiella intermedia TaxID=45354 RepID=A0A1L0BIP9_9ASCO|nr:CIC11C00000001827 [[Candida] intermedia]SGZ50090.1 CIC11C00000003534 [[Candida] intermedia]
MLKVALVVIDLQEDFLPPDGSLAVADGRSIVPAISDLLNTEKYPWLAVIVTQDWHPANHCLFASQHGVQPYTELEFEHPLGEKNCVTGEIKKQKQFVWPDHCVQESFGATVESLFLEKFEQLNGKLPTALVKKGYLQDREYYLCFTDCWKLHKTEMEEVLQTNGITDVVFVGLAYDFCVLNSAVDCLDSGFNTFVIRSCSKSVYPDKVDETEKLYRDAGVHIVETVEDLMKHYT